MLHTKRKRITGLRQKTMTRSITIGKRFQRTSSLVIAHAYAWTDVSNRVAESYNGSIHNLGNLKESPYTRGKPDVVTSENASGAKIYDPYPNYQSTGYRNAFSGSHVSCIGARGVRLNESYEDMVWAYDGAPSGPSHPIVSILIC